LVYCAWEGEEPALLGSTEWAEAHREELVKNAVAYVNSDGNGRGYLGAGGSHTLEKLVNEVAKDVEDPETKGSVWQRMQANDILNGGATAKKEARTRGDLRIAALGSGSDFTPFLQFAGVATLDLGFGGEDGGGIYHSIYDDFYWYTHFSDTSFVYGRALSQVAGTTMMRIADAELLPWAFTNLAETASGYMTELEKLRDTRADEIDERNRQIRDGVFTATDDPREPMAAPKHQDPAPHLNSASLHNALDVLSRAADDYEAALKAADDKGGAALSAPGIAAINAKLIQAERQLTSEAGLPKRPWYKHLLYAPGLYTGYGVKTMPAVREAIEQGRWAEADTEMQRIAVVIEAEAKLVKAAADGLNQIARGDRPVP
ncbi:MAG TPA: transferrin receptor-like dimerization domain-containing protein, partial [Gemmatimonadaceae bacterium]